MSSTVSALTTRKLPSFSPTASAFPSGEKAQQRPPAEHRETSPSEHGAATEKSTTELQLKGFHIKHGALEQISYLLKQICYRGL